MASKQFEPPSGTRDFLARDLRRREHVFAAARQVFGRYGFEPLQTPAFERLETLTGKYGDEGDKLIFKILRRGEHEASGEGSLWAAGPVRHPFPIGLLSLQFNWRYMKQHGIRAFYEMTGRYLAELAASNDTWRAGFEAEQAGGTLDRITTVECDLASEEAPMHCDICKKTITALSYLEG